jgi:hypothetical protein
MPFTLRQICLVAADLNKVIDDLKNVLGLEVCYVDPNVVIFGLQNSLLPIGTNFIEVVSPVKDGTTAGRYLERRGGNGGYMVLIQADSQADRDACRSRARDMGIRVAWEFTLETSHFMQLHPADTGGCFFEIDWDDKNQHTGHWVAADGLKWKSHVKTDLVSEIKGVEIQSGNPDKLAARWSAIVDIPLRDGPDGRPEIPLNNAVIRFVKAEDGRGEGLGGIDIKATDPAGLLGAAAKRGLKMSEAQVMIGGVRFNLVP